MKREMLILVLLVVGFALVGCSKQHARPYDASFAATNPDSVQVLYSFPDRAHERIGAVNVRHYRPGWGEPTLEQAVPRIQRTGAEIGAHAVVVLNHQATSDRQIHVTGEAIRWVDP